jgi:hypothetical protein
MESGDVLKGRGDFEVSDLLVSKQRGYHINTIPP